MAIAPAPAHAPTSASYGPAKGDDSPRKGAMSAPASTNEQPERP